MKENIMGRKKYIDKYSPKNKKVCEDIQIVINSGFYKAADILGMYEGLDEKTLKEEFNTEKLIRDSSAPVSDDEREDEQDLIEEEEELDEDLDDDEDDWDEDEDEEEDEDTEEDDDTEPEQQPVIEDVIDDEVKQLLASFEQFKSSVESDQEDIIKLFVLLETKCPYKVTELWHDMVKKHYAKIVRGGTDPVSDFDYRFYIMEFWFSEIAWDNDKLQVIKPALLEDDLILPTLYKYCLLEQYPDEFLAELIVAELYEKADYFFSLIAVNKVYRTITRYMKAPLVEIVESINSPLTDIIWAIDDIEGKKKRHTKITQLKEKVERIKAYLRKKIDEEQDQKIKTKADLAYTKVFKDIDKEVAEL